MNTQQYPEHILKQADEMAMRVSIAAREIEIIKTNLKHEADFGKVSIISVMAALDCIKEQSAKHYAAKDRQSQEVDRTVVSQHNEIIQLKARVAELERELWTAINAAEYVVKLVEANTKAGDSPNPFEKADWIGTVAHCYAAMSFVNHARQLLCPPK